MKELHGNLKQYTLESSGESPFRLIWGDQEAVEIHLLADRNLAIKQGKFQEYRDETTVK